MTNKTGHYYYSEDWVNPFNEDPTPKSPSRSDCSQWVRAIYLQAGCHDPGTNTDKQAARGHRTNNPRPGDLMMAHDTGHVELYYGGTVTIGHGSKPIDIAHLDNFPGHYFVTFEFLD